MSFVINLLISASVISFCAWLSKYSRQLAGFIIALPISTLLVLALSQIQNKNAEQSVEFAKSILAALPLTTLFFVPFFLAKRFEMGFWTCYLSGLGLLCVGFLIHKFFFGIIH